jgi:hypothetical protein
MPYLVSRDGQSFDPFEIDELTVYVKEGSILLTDHCWHEGWDQWYPIHSVVSVPVPVAVSRRKDKTSQRIRPVEVDEKTLGFSRKKAPLRGSDRRRHTDLVLRRQPLLDALPIEACR